jgi:hypothetical protein
MNERIRQLAIEAGAHWEHGDWNMPSAVYFSERELEKFAELIVKECMKLNRDILCEDDPDYLDQVYNEHFGVG